MNNMLNGAVGLAALLAASIATAAPAMAQKVFPSAQAAADDLVAAAKAGRAGFVAAGEGSVAGREADELVEETGGGFFAKHNAALGTELDLENGAGVDAEGMADRLGQGELALAGDGGFHFLTFK